MSTPELLRKFVCVVAAAALFAGCSSDEGEERKADEGEGELTAADEPGAADDSAKTESDENEGKESRDEEQESQDEAGWQDPHSLDEVVRLGKYEIQVHGVTVGEEAEEQWSEAPPKEGHEYILADVEQHDTEGDSDSRMVFIAGVDGEGNEYARDDEARCEGGLPVTEKEPENPEKSSMRKVYCLQVPEEAMEELVLKVDYRLEGEAAHFELPRT